MPNDAPTDLDLWNESYQLKVEDIATRWRNEYVVPFCDRMNFRFDAGNGGWLFTESKTGTTYGDGVIGAWSGPRLSDRPDDDSKAIAKILSVEDIRGHEIGDYMENYTPSTWEKKP
jgi:hypothetical protein